MIKRILIVALIIFTLLPFNVSANIGAILGPKPIVEEHVEKVYENDTKPSS